MRSQDSCCRASGVGGRTAVWCLAVVAGCGPSLAAESTVDFVRDVQPLLARRCFACHGPETQEGGLRLDGEEASRAVLDSQLRAVVPGDVAASVMLARITADAPDIRMPPEGP
ncbi:MAG: c-type cytochrome domain-containing protein, partial [Planctomycetota bacterium]